MTCLSQPPATWQINVVVGAFFVISGYVAAYTTTALGQTLGRSYGLGSVHGNVPGTSNEEDGHFERSR